MIPAYSRNLNKFIRVRSRLSSNCIPNSLNKIQSFCFGSVISQSVHFKETCVNFSYERNYSRFKMGLPETSTRATEMGTMGDAELKCFMGKIDAVMFDCDGVLWLGSEPLENAAQLVIHLRSMGKRVFFLMNNSMKTRLELLEKFNKLGFQATEEEIVSTAYLTALYLKELNFKRKAYVIGSTGITQELANFGIQSLPIGPDPVASPSLSWSSDDYTDIDVDPEVGAVIVGFDHHFSYLKALRAATYLNQKNVYGEDRLFIGTNTDEQFPTSGGKKLVYPGTGTFVAAVKTCSGRKPTVMGKPETFPFELVRRQCNLDPNRVLMVGDRGNTDILFGKNCGLWTLLVLTGVTSLADLHRWEQSTVTEEQHCVPNFYATDVNQFYQLIAKIS